MMSYHMYSIYWQPQSHDNIHMYHIRHCATQNPPKHKNNQQALDKKKEVVYVVLFISPNIFADAQATQQHTNLTYHYPFHYQNDNSSPSLPPPIPTLQQSTTNYYLSHSLVFMIETLFWILSQDHHQLNNLCRAIESFSPAQLYDLYRYKMLALNQLTRAKEQAYFVIK